MEEVKRKRGRPRIDAGIVGLYSGSRRQVLNKTYMYEGMHLLKVAATEIQNGVEILRRMGGVA